MEWETGWWREGEWERLSHTNLTEELFYRDWQPFLLGWPHQSLPLLLFCSSSLTILLLPPFFCTLTLLISSSISLSSLTVCMQRAATRCVACWLGVEICDVWACCVVHSYYGNPRLGSLVSHFQNKMLETQIKDVNYWKWWNTFHPNKDINFIDNVQTYLFTSASQ